MVKFIDPEKKVKKKTEFIVQFLSQSDLNWYNDSFYGKVKPILKLKDGIKIIESEVLDDTDYRLIKREITETVLYIKSDKNKLRRIM